METGPLIVIILRLIVPLLILRWPLFGGLLALLLDYLDLTLITAINRGDFTNYQAIDKLLDTYYLSLEAFIVTSWQGKLKNIGLSLFIIRMLGIVLFEVTGLRRFLFFFPNLFEVFFLFTSAYKEIINKYPSFRQLWVKALISLLFIYKIYQEFSLHIANFNPWLGSQILGIK